MKWKERQADRQRPKEQERDGEEGGGEAASWYKPTTRCSRCLGIVY